MKIVANTGSKKPLKWFSIRFYSSINLTYPYNIIGRPLDRHEKTNNTNYQVQSAEVLKEGVTSAWNSWKG